MTLLVILISVLKKCTSLFDFWSHNPKIGKLKMHICHVMCNSKNNKNAWETAKKLSNVYGQFVITDYVGYHPPFSTQWTCPSAIYSSSY